MTVKPTAMIPHVPSLPTKGTRAGLQALIFISNPLDSKPLDDDAAALIKEVAALLNEREREEAESTLLFNSTCHRCPWWRGDINRDDGFAHEGDCKARPWEKHRTSYNDTCPDFTTKAQWLAKLKGGIE